MSVSRSTTAPTSCTAGAVACYEMNDTGSTMVDSTTPASSLPHATGGGSGIERVSRDGVPSEYFFPGWKGHTSEVGGSTLGMLKANATIARTFGEAVVDKTGITTGETFNPGTGPWRIKTKVRPYLVRVAGQTGEHLPAPSSCTNGCGAAKPSYNLIQKGRNGKSVPGGFYKLEIMGYAGTQGGLSYVKGSVHCQFLDSDGTSVDAFSGTGTNAKVVDRSYYYTISCYRSGNSVTLSVTEETPTPQTQTVSGVRTREGARSGLGSVSPDNGAGATRFSPMFSIGKKPMSTAIEDSFAGWVSYVNLSTT